MTRLIQYVERDSPRQAEIVSYLRQRIISGEFKPGTRLPTVASIVDNFAASNRTVQKALEYLESADFIRRISRRGTFVAEYPPHLSHIGLVFPVPESSISSFQIHKAFKTVAERISKTCKSGNTSKLRFSFFYSSSISSASADHKALTDAVDSHQMAGLVFVQDGKVFENTPVMTSKSLPRVLIGFRRHPGMTVLQVDYGKFYEKALNYLHSRGRRRVAFIVSSNQFKCDRNLFKIVQPLLALRGMETCPQWMNAVAIDAGSWAGNCVRMLLSCPKAHRPDSLIIGDDNLVSPATSALVEMGVGVPQEIELVTHCNFPTPPDTAVPVARLGFNVSDMLKTAINVIQRKRQNLEVPELIEIDPLLSEPQEQQKNLPDNLLDEEAHI